MHKNNTRDQISRVQIPRSYEELMVQRKSKPYSTDRSALPPAAVEKTVFTGIEENLQVTTESRPGEKGQVEEP